MADHFDKLHARITQLGQQCRAVHHGNLLHSLRSQLVRLVQQFVPLGVLVCLVVQLKALVGDHNASSSTLIVDLLCCVKSTSMVISANMVIMINHHT